MLLPQTRADDDDASSPVSPWSYFFPLLVVILVCGGYVFWRRAQRRSESGIPLNFARGATGVRLSEDGPPTHSFISNNASTDSLPSHALNDLPTLRDTHPARTSPLPRTGLANTRTSTCRPSQSAASHGRRSNKVRRAGAGPVEGSRSGSGSEDEDDGLGGQGGPFEIGAEGSDDPGSDDELGPLGRR